VNATASVKGLRWPVLETGSRTLVSGLEQLRRSEALSPAELEAFQFDQLSELLGWSYTEIPFYRERLGAAGFDPTMPLTRDVWQRIPVVERADVQSLGTRLCATPPPDHGRITEVNTSGSTGRPIHALKTNLTMLFWSLAVLRDHEWHARDCRSTLAAIRWFPDGVNTYPAGGHQPNWGGPIASVFSSGPSYGLSITATAREQAEWLGRIQPHYLLVYPSLLPDLARECRAQGGQLTNLRGVRTIAEHLDPEIRELCRREWNVPVHDTYSAHEIGCIALQCPEHDHYHVQSEDVFVEILSEDGEPCVAGDVGRVVLTPLHNFAMPLIRYAIGDYAEPGPPCACGRGLPVLRRVLGRARNMLALPDGGRLWPRLGELRYADVLPISQYQVVQKSLHHLELRLVVPRRGTVEEEERLKAILIGRVGYPFEVAIRYVDRIVRGPGGKFEEFSSDVGGPE